MDNTCYSDKDGCEDTRQVYKGNIDPDMEDENQTLLDIRSVGQGKAILFSNHQSGLFLRRGVRDFGIWGNWIALVADAHTDTMYTNHYDRRFFNINAHGNILGWSLAHLITVHVSGF